ncbi:hypothetical protein V1511DRAFT_502110 [Dipodascopsis uninucleata]
MISQLPWKTLVVESKESFAKLPPLLYSYEFDTRVPTYSIIVTDLVSSWSESLDRNEIVTRANNEKLAVDVSIPSNLSALLEMLEGSLSGKQPDATVKLSNSQINGIILLSVSAPLANSGLNLNWSFQLSNLEDSSGSVSRPMILSCFATIESLHQQLEALKGVIAQKDEHLSAILSILREVHSAYKPRKNKSSLEKFDFQQWQNTWPVHNRINSSDSISDLVNESSGIIDSHGISMDSSALDRIPRLASYAFCNDSPEINRQKLTSQSALRNKSLKSNETDSGSDSEYVSKATVKGAIVGKRKWISSESSDSDSDSHEISKNNLRHHKKHITSKEDNESGATLESTSTFPLQVQSSPTRSSHKEALNDQISPLDQHPISHSQDEIADRRRKMFQQLSNSKPAVPLRRRF